MNKQIKQYKEFANEIDGKYKQKAENVLLLQSDIFIISKELSNIKGNIVFNLQISRPAYHSYKYINYIYLYLHNKKAENIHIKKTFLSKILPLKSKYNLKNQSSLYEIECIKMIEKHKFETIEEIFCSKDNSIITVKCASIFLDFKELIGLYKFVVDISKIIT